MIRTSAVLAVLIAACPAPAAGQDTLTLRSDGQPVWGTSPQLREELRIGVALGDPDYALGNVAGVAVMPDGSIWVSDRLRSSVRRYSAEGRFVGDVGREGEGPGEFRHLMDLRLVPGNTVAVWDPLNQRIHRFDLEGRLVDDLRVPVAGYIGGPNLQDIEVDTAGNLYVIDFVDGWLKVSPEGQILDTIRRPPSNRDGTRDPVVTQAALSPLGYRWTGRTDEYVFHRPLPDGRVVRLERHWEPVPYQRAERNEAQTLEEHFAERNSRPARRIPSNKLPWASFEVDAEGRLWVERYVTGQQIQETEAQRDARIRFANPPRTWGQPLVYDVIEPDGRYLGSLTFPNSATATLSGKVNVRLARGLDVWTVERGEFDEQYVVRYRIVPDPGR